MTLSRLARLAHVSVSTASKAFSMSREVNEETRKMIFDIARKEGCFKKFFNAKYPKFVVAVLCPELDSLYYAEQVMALQRELNARGFESCTAVTNFSEEVLKDTISYYDTYASVDGILLIGGSEQALPPHETPLVTIGSNCKDSAASIHYDFLPAMKKAIQYFYLGGIHDIGFVGDPLTGSKRACFEKAMEEITGNSHEHRITVSKERFEAGGYAAAKQMFKNNDLPEALLCAYDSMAFGAIRYLSEQSIDVPGKVKVIGMDNISVDAYTTPSLSSIGIDNNKLAKQAVDKITNILAGNQKEESDSIDVQLFLRESSVI